MPKLKNKFDLFTMRCGPSFKDTLARAAAQEQMTMTKFIETAVAEKVARLESQKG